MSLEGALSFFIAIFIFGITPGPGVFAILAKALTQGHKACFSLILGMVMSDIVYLIATCFGLASLASHWNEVFTLIRLIGAFYLLYLGWKLWTAPIVVDTLERAENNRQRRLSFLQGFLISASNPKVILFYIAFLPTFMDLSALSNTDIALASVLTFAALMLGLMLIARFAAKARSALTSEQAQRHLNRGAGALMMGAGVYLFAR